MARKVSARIKNKEKARFARTIAHLEKTLSKDREGGRNSRNQRASKKF